MIQNMFMAHVYAVLVIGTFLGLIPMLIMYLLGWLTLQTPLVYQNLYIGMSIFVGASGGALSYSCMILFIIHGKGTAFPTDPPKKFVVIGPYKYVRNPMYIGNLVLAIGIGLFLQSITYIVYVVGLAGIIHLYIAYYEEPRLRERFGSSYEDYCRSVKRWIISFPDQVTVD